MIYYDNVAMLMIKWETFNDYIKGNKINLKNGSVSLAENMWFEPAVKYESKKAVWEFGIKGETNKQSKGNTLENIRMKQIEIERNRNKSYKKHVKRFEPKCPERCEIAC